MEDREEIIVSFTTWKPRIHNIPIVVDSLLSQTLLPDKIVINLACHEIIPYEVNNYIIEHSIEINRVEDTKVYKKLLPTLLKYPNACIINIDDDFIYPSHMIHDFLTMHKRYPNNPISGNNQVLYGMQCHCGCASLTKKEYFGELLTSVDEELISHCKSDDLVFSYLATLAGHPYLRTKNAYFYNMQAIESSEPYSSFDYKKVFNETYQYLNNRLGALPNVLSILINNNSVMKDWHQMPLLYSLEHYYASSHTHRKSAA